MNWKQALTSSPPGPHGQDLLRGVLLDRISEYRAPTDMAAWRREAPRLRRKALAEVFLRGYPADIVRAEPRVVWGDVLRPCDAYVIRKLRYEAFPNYWIPALLYEPVGLTPGGPKVPAVLNANGHHAGGKACDYKQARCANLARRGMLALNTEFIGMSELQADAAHNNQAHLSLTGQAGVGLFYLAMKKGLDVLLAHRSADPRRVCMTGLSGGGWQTIVLSALDPRITVSVPVAGYTAMRARVLHACDRGDLEQMSPDLVQALDYQQMTAMLAPRPALLILNENDDCCFQTARTRPYIYDAVRPVYAAMKAQAAFETHSNQDPGIHNYEADNRAQLYRFLDRHFGLSTAAGDVHEERELLPESALNVGLPDEQETMLTLALKRAQALEKRRTRPRTAAQRRARRQAVERVIRLPELKTRVRRVAQSESRGGSVGLYEMKTGPWRVPVAVRNGSGRGRSVKVVINDGGWRDWHEWDAAYKGDLYVPDILGAGVNALAATCVSLLESTGSRLLGIQVAQIQACVEFAQRRSGAARVELECNGRASWLPALVAAALNPHLFCSLRVSWETMTLKYLMQWPVPFDAAPAAFCFGLLEVVDVPDLIELLEGVELRPWGRCVPAHVPGRSERAGKSSR